MRLKTLWEILKETGSKWMDDNVPRLSAAVAFYSLFSLAPLLVIAVSIAGMIYGERAARGELVVQIRHAVGEHGAFVIQHLVASAYNFRSGVLASILASLALFFGATAVFVELQGAMDTIWGIKSRSRGFALDFFRQRLIAFVMSLGIGFLLLLSLFASTLINFLSDHLGIVARYLPLYRYGDILISFAIITILFAMIYKILPSAKVAWGNVWFGAFVTSFLFTGGKFLIGLYLGHSTVESIFGAAGSLVILLFWIYYSAQVFFFGAELTYIYSNRSGSKIEAHQ